jgi:uncharacterized membrane protein
MTARKDKHNVTKESASFAGFQRWNMEICFLQESRQQRSYYNRRKAQGARRPFFTVFPGAQGKRHI